MHGTTVKNFYKICLKITFSKNTFGGKTSSRILRVEIHVLKTLYDHKASTKWKQRMACTFSAQRHNSKTISLPLVLFTDSLQKKKGGGGLNYFNAILIGWLLWLPKMLYWITKLKHTLKLISIKRYVYFLTTYLIKFYYHQRMHFLIQPCISLLSYIKIT